MRNLQYIRAYFSVELRDADRLTADEKTCGGQRPGQGENRKR